MADIEKTRAVVETSETYQGSITPTERAEIGRPVTIGANATVTEGVYGETVTVDRGATIDGPIMAKEAIELTEATATSEVGTPGRVVCEGSTIEGTVTGARVTLSDCTVYGNVVGGEVRLEDCSVIGTVTSEGSLRLSGTTCYTFSAHADADIEDVTVVLPQVIVDGALSLSEPIPVLSVRLDDGEQTFAELTGGDRYEDDEHTYLTLAPRVLDIEGIREEIETLESFLRSAVTAAKTDEATFHTEYDADWLLEHFDVDVAE